MIRLRFVVAALASIAAFAPAAQAQPARSMPLIVPVATEAFGHEVTIDERSFVYVSGRVDFDSVYDALVAALKKVHLYLDKEGIRPAGPPIARYTDGGQEGFQFQAGYPLAETPKNPPQDDIAVGETPSGRMLDFDHRGSFNTMDDTYAAIDDYFRDKRKSAGLAEPERDELANSFEEYTTDPSTSNPEKLEVHVLVPVRQ
jgi:effector-binding domain-containing protein